MLFWQDTFFLNGDAVTAPAILTPILTTLADQRYVDCGTLTPEQLSLLATTLYEAYLAGYVLMREDME
jgi:50S ribosomal protein L16 3-hydroxylase